MYSEKTFLLFAKNHKNQPGSFKDTSNRKCGPFLAHP